MYYVGIVVEVCLQFREGKFLMAARIKLETKDMLAQYGNVELVRTEDRVTGKIQYVCDDGSRLQLMKIMMKGTPSYIIEDIFVQTRMSIIGADRMKIKHLFTSGLAYEISVYKLVDGDSWNYHWVKDGYPDLLEGTYSEEW